MVNPLTLALRHVATVLTVGMVQAAVWHLLRAQDSVQKEDTVVGGSRPVCLVSPENMV